MTEDPFGISFPPDCIIGHIRRRLYDTSILTADTCFWKLQSPLHRCLTTPHHSDAISPSIHSLLDNFKFLSESNDVIRLLEDCDIMYDYFLDEDDPPKDRDLILKIFEILNTS